MSTVQVPRPAGVGFSAAPCLIAKPSVAGRRSRGCALVQAAAEVARRARHWLHHAQLLGATARARLPPCRLIVGCPSSLSQLSTAEPDEEKLKQQTQVMDDDERSSAIADKVRGLVSKKKKRFKDDGFDLVRLRARGSAGVAGVALSGLAPTGSELHNGPHHRHGLPVRVDRGPVPQQHDGVAGSGAPRDLWCGGLSDTIAAATGRMCCASSRSGTP
jgi:hypothetical protein